VIGAENQQERLIKVGWIVGFVDGEGCFSIGIVQQKNSLKRKGYRLGYEIFHEFAVTQGKKSLESLQEIQNYFGIGKIYENKRYDNHKENLYRYVVRKREELVKIIIPFFQKYKLRSSKRYDFEKFAFIVDLVLQGKHLERDGLIEIVKIVETMNRCKQHDPLIKILTHYTSGAQKGKDIVAAA
jgi:hypothetical protein